MPNRSLFLTLALSVVGILTIGALVLLEWRGSQPVDPDAAEEIADRSLMNLEALQHELEADIASRPKSAVQERLDSPVGQALFRKCSEWLEFHDNHPDEEIRDHRDRACREYRDYVDNGTVPPVPDNRPST